MTGWVTSDIPFYHSTRCSRLSWNQIVSAKEKKVKKVKKYKQTLSKTNKQPGEKEWGSKKMMHSHGSKQSFRFHQSLESIFEGESTVIVQGINWSPAESGQNPPLSSLAWYCTARCIMGDRPHLWNIQFGHCQRQSIRLDGLFSSMESPVFWAHPETYFLG